MKISQAIILGAAITTATTCAFGAEQQVTLTSFRGPATYDGRTLKQVFVAEYGTQEKTEREASIECNRGSEPYIRLPINPLKFDSFPFELGRAFLQGTDENDPSSQGSFLIKASNSDINARIQLSSKTFNEIFLKQLYKGSSAIKLISQEPANRNDVYEIIVTEPSVATRIADLAFLCPNFD